jgi:hypothetical protein
MSAAVGMKFVHMTEVCHGFRQETLSDNIEGETQAMARRSGQKDLEERADVSTLRWDQKNIVLAAVEAHVGQTIY